MCIRDRWREMITFNELQQVGSVQEKQDRSKDRALWYSIDNCRWRRTGRRSANMLNSVAEIRRKPVDDFPVETVGLSQPLKEHVMGNSHAIWDHTVLPASRQR